MKKKFLVASHGKLAAGLQNSLDILAGKGSDIEIICAYLTDEDYTPQIIDFIKSIKDDEQAIIATDFFGGSVNQKAVESLLNQGKHNNIFIISNINLPVLLALVLTPEKLTRESILNTIQEGQVQLIDTTPQTTNNDDDDFFN